MSIRTDTLPWFYIDIVSAATVYTIPRRRPVTFTYKYQPFTTFGFHIRKWEKKKYFYEGVTTVLNFALKIEPLTAVIPVWNDKWVIKLLQTRHGKTWLISKPAVNLEVVKIVPVTDQIGCCYVTSFVLVDFRYVGASNRGKINTTWRIMTKRYFATFPKKYGSIWLHTSRLFKIFSI